MHDESAHVTWKSAFCDLVLDDCDSSGDSLAMRMTFPPFRIPVFSVLAACLLFVGCTSPRYEHFPLHHVEVELTHEPDETPVRKLPIFTGDGVPITWADLLDAAAWADIIILGEQHDDAIGHAVQLAVTEDVFDHWPRSRLAMEMLERDEQILVDDFFEDIIDTATFIRLTHSANWAGEGSWEKWFQPIIDAVRARSESGTGVSPVIAANAPRRYVRLARTAGYDRLRALPAERRAHFDLPRNFRKHLRSPYRARFGSVMRHVHADDLTDDERAEQEAAQEQRIDTVFRSQLLWDATMAASIARARPSHNRKVIHLVGQFHSDFEGGLVRELRMRLPGARILTVSMQRRWQDSLHDDDDSRADVIIYTGERPPPETAEEDIEESESSSEDGEGHADSASDD